MKRIINKMDMAQIRNLIEDISYIDDLQKAFYKKMLESRKELILDFSYKKLLNQELEKKNMEPVNDLKKTIYSPRL